MTEFYRRNEQTLYRDTVADFARMTDRQLRENIASGITLYNELFPPKSSWIKKLGKVIAVAVIISLAVTAVATTTAGGAASASGAAAANAGVATTASAASAQVMYQQPRPFYKPQALTFPTIYNGWRTYFQTRQPKP